MGKTTEAKLYQVNLSHHSLESTIIYHKQLQV